MYKFIYVFSKEKAEQLKEIGFALVKEDADKGIYVFENPESATEKICFSNNDFVLSNMLIF